MTDDVDLSKGADGVAYAFAETISSHGAVGDGWIVPSSDVSATDDTATKTSTGSKGAFAKVGESGLDVTFDTGEFFVGGSWGCRDTQTTISLADNTTDQTIELGWDADTGETVLIGERGTSVGDSFASRDPSIDLYTFDTDSGAVTNETDERTVGKETQLGQSSLGSGTELTRCTGSDSESSDGNSGDGGEEQTVLQWHGGYGDGEGDDVKEDVREALWDAGLSEDIYVEIQDTPETTDETLDQYRTWLSAGREEPHMMMFDSGWTIPFIVRGQLQNMGEILSSNTIGTIQDEYFSASVQSATGPSDGELYGVPMFPDFPTMQYRKDLVEDAGYDTSDWQTNPISWERFADITADVLDQNSDLDYGYTFQADNYEGLSCCNFNEWITTWGGAFFGDPEENLFGPVGDRPITVDEQPVIDSIKMVKAFVYGNDHDDAMDDITGNIASKDALGWTEETSRAPFSNGNAVMHRNWPYSIGINGRDPDEVGEDEPAYGEDLGVMPIPYGVTEDDAATPNTGGSAAALGGWNLVVNPNVQDGEVTDAVSEFVEAVMSDEFQVFQFKHANIGNIPAKTSVLEGDEVRDLPVMGRYIDAILTAGENAMPRPVTAAWPDESGAIADEANAAYRDEKSAEQAMSDLSERLQAIEAENAE